MRLREQRQCELLKLKKIVGCKITGWGMTVADRWKRYLAVKVEYRSNISQKDRRMKI